MKKRFVAFSATVRDVRRTKREGEETGEGMKKKRAEEDKERGHRTETKDKQDKRFGCWLFCVRIDSLKEFVIKIW